MVPPMSSSSNGTSSNSTSIFWCTFHFHQTTLTLFFCKFTNCGNEFVTLAGVPCVMKERDTKTAVPAHFMRNCHEALHNCNYTFVFRLRVCHVYGWGLLDLCRYINRHATAPWQRGPWHCMQHYQIAGCLSSSISIWVWSCHKWFRCE